MGVVQKNVAELRPLAIPKSIDVGFDAPLALPMLGWHGIKNAIVMSADSTP